MCAATGAPDAAQDSYAAADLESRALAMYAPAVAGGAPRADTPAEADAQVSPSRHSAGCPMPLRCALPCPRRKRRAQSGCLRACIVTQELLVQKLRQQKAEKVHLARMSKLARKNGAKKSAGRWR